MSDLVERLKFHGRYGSENNEEMALRKRDEREEAAAEILRLRAEVKSARLAALQEALVCLDKYSAPEACNAIEALIAQEEADAK